METGWDPKRNQEDRPITEGKKNLLLTGRPGVGKTTLVRRVLDQLKGTITVGGFWTEEVRGSQGRIGFRIVTTEGQKGWLAKKGVASPQRVGSYGVYLESIETIIIPSLKRAMENAQLIIIDEIGKMELSHPSFSFWVWRCLQSLVPVLGVLQQSPLSFLDRIKRRSDVALIVVTEQNRDALVPYIVALIEQRVGGMCSS
ncbi:MAG: NTPase [Armatimonadetes bacterium]|nr:NTPase [Armatimonadota bacterium]MDW8122489.1 NTPase [Armatimonadota bacterium]